MVWGSQLAPCRDSVCSRKAQVRSAEGAFRADQGVRVLNGLSGAKPESVPVSTSVCGDWRQRERLPQSVAPSSRWKTSPVLTAKAHASPEIGSASHVAPEPRMSRADAEPRPVMSEVRQPAMTVPRSP